MGLAITEEHQALAGVVRSFVEAHGGRAEARAHLEDGDGSLPASWAEIAEMGWLGLHIPEEHGGQGYGFLELAIVVEGLGRSLVPGPFLPTALAAAILSRFGGADHHADIVPSLAAGERNAGIGLHGSLTRDRGGALEGDAGLVLGGDVADTLVLAVGDDLVLIDRHHDGVTVRRCDNLDSTRRVARIECDSVQVTTNDVLVGARQFAVRVGRALAAAEAAGGAQACTEMANEYAKTREQFGRTIGTFQAVKHHSANMLVASERAVATAWDAARILEDDDQGDLAAAIAATVALPAYLQCARLNIQIHGGIGFTWEHDAHMYLRRAGALAATFGRSEESGATVTRLMRAGTARTSSVDLPPEAEEFRLEVRNFVDHYRTLPEPEQRDALVESGYLMPHWPKPWGRGAGPIEQIVIDEEFGGTPRPNLGISGWVTQTLAQHGTSDQLDRWIKASLSGSLSWCQLFSEPGAGSDAAAISTRGTRVEGGWVVNGQKVWTSGAQHANQGMATVRTDADAPKHAGITMMAIDMNAAGVEVRPLREITGNAAFNEVFFDDVFVADDDVVGEVNGGWTVARSTFGNERVAIGAGFGDATGRATELLGLLDHDDTSGLGFESEVGALLADEAALQLLNLRQVERAVAGAGAGPEGNVGKLLAAEHSQRIAALGMRMLGARGATLDATDSRMAYLFLFTPGLTIAGGTSEIVRNQIAERILGLPRDPLTR